MTYDACRLRGNGDSAYDPLASSSSDYTTHQGSHDRKPRDSSPSTSLRREHRDHHDHSVPRRRISPSEMGSTIAERVEQSSSDGVSPELIAAITEKVKREVFEQLKQTGSVEGLPRGLTVQRSASIKSNSTSSPPPSSRGVHTPPSPTQTGRHTHAQSYMPPTAESVRSRSRSPPEEPTRRNHSVDKTQPATRTPSEKPSASRVSGHTSSPTRPAGEPRTYSTMELSTIDQKWGKLYESDGKPTQRLGQFFRGLANHIIEEFSPKKTIVVTPSKMAAFYAAHAVDKEPHPLLTIFRAQSHEHISQLYQDLGCQHHLVQEGSHSAPFIPSLTPVGFAHWMTINLLAYPEEEHQRLEKVVIAMPINADGDLVDGKPERLPKQMSRYLLPEKEDRSSRKLLDRAIENFLEELGSTSRRRPSITSPPLSRNSSSSKSRSHDAPIETHQTRTSPTTTKAQPLERERKPYGGVPSASETSNNTPTTTTTTTTNNSNSNNNGNSNGNNNNNNNEEGVKLERDRQPYSAQPGSGKVHADSDRHPAQTGSGKSHPDSASKNATRPTRATSTSSRNSEASGDQVRPGRAGSTASRYPPRAARNSSPPFRNFSQSTPEEIHSSKYGHNPTPSASSSNQNQSSSAVTPSQRGSDPVFPPPPSGPPPIDIHRRSRDDRYRRNGNEEDDRFTSQFSSPREAEKWDRYHEESSSRAPPYKRGSTSVDPRDRGAPLEEWYREKGRGPEHNETYGGGRRY